MQAVIIFNHSRSNIMKLTIWHVVKYYNLGPSLQDLLAVTEENVDKYTTEHMKDAASKYNSLKNQHKQLVITVDVSWWWVARYILKAYILAGCKATSSCFCEAASLYLARKLHIEQGICYQV